MNNTSVILLFEVGARPLFPGDAQVENWSYALEDAPDHEATRALLADVDLYKVGHHGSLNATPKKLLWEGFRKRGSGKRLKIAPPSSRAFNDITLTTTSFPPDYFDILHLRVLKTDRTATPEHSDLIFAQRCFRYVHIGA